MESHRRLALQFAGLLFLSGLAACAKLGEPQPPQLLVPKPAIDLEARQYSNRIQLTVSQPAENTNGSRVTTLDRIEVSRLVGDRTNAGPIPEDIFLAGAREILNVPATQVPKYLVGDRLVFQDTPGGSDPASLSKSGFHYAVRFINRSNQTAGFSNQVFVAPLALPSAPAGLAFGLFRDYIRLTWDAPDKNIDGSVPPRIIGYNLYRTGDPKTPAAAPLNPEPIPRPEYQDRDFEFDKTYYYAVSVVASKENPYAESDPSGLLAVPARDTFPPGSPKNLTSVVEKGVVTLLWSPPEDADVAGYRVYRREDGSAENVPLQEQLITTLSFRDQQVVPGKKYEYNIVAVDTHGNVSRPAITTVEVQ